MSKLTTTLSTFCYKINQFSIAHLDVWRLRNEHRLVGSFVGALPAQPRQVTHAGLPIRLMKEEVALAIQKGWAKLGTRADLAKPPSAEERDIAMAIEESNFQEQQRVRTQFKDIK